jgi:hypothetical protein
VDQQLIHSSFPEKNLQTFSSGQSKSIRPVVLYLSAVNGGVPSRLGLLQEQTDLDGAPGARAQEEQGDV